MAIEKNVYMKGNSCLISLPTRFVNELELKIGDYLEFQLENEKVIIKRIEWKRYDRSISSVTEAEKHDSLRETIRKIQFRNPPTVILPSSIVKTLGIDRDSKVNIAIINDRIIMMKHEKVIESLEKLKKGESVDEDFEKFISLK
jgi:antitoxin component of MazEF toxin-antitoxin module